jgi:shikimate 5-dehydrogenase
MKPAAHQPPCSGRRILTGLLGAPIAHSASPAMHERAAEALGLRCHYQLVEVAGAGRDELKVLLEGVRRLGFAGTPLLTAAKAKGAAVMSGRELAIHQAADAFELFTGLVPSTAEMGIAFDGVMAKRYAASNAA